ncbi:MAG: SRPBCC domain-containing protein [Trueperaceae bacterium]|nr:SRPBCC domain-containing protein [Trueperaceae bacterium]
MDAERQALSDVPGVAASLLTGDPGSLARPFETVACKIDLRFTAVITMEAQGDGTRYVAIAKHRDEAGRSQHEEIGFEQGWGTALDQRVDFDEGVVGGRCAPRLGRAPGRGARRTGALSLADALL